MNTDVSDDCEILEHLEFETDTGLPVTSSNHAMAWHCLRITGVNDACPELGACLNTPCDRNGVSRAA